MPIQYQNVQLYGINEITGPLRQEFGRNPTVRIVQGEAGDWLVEVRKGIAEKSVLLGYLYDGTSAKPSSFPSRKDAGEAVLWAMEFLVIKI